MRNTLLYFLRFYLFWMLLFFFYRILFLVFNYELFSELTASVLLQIFIHSLRIDFSTATYLVFTPFLLMTFYLFSRQLIFEKVNTIGSNIILLIVTIVFLANIVMYKVWGTPLSKRAIQFLRDPHEIISSLSTLQLIGAIIAIVSFFFLSRFVFNKIVGHKFPDAKFSVIQKIISLFIVLFVGGIGLRGGWQLIPINESASYFSNVPQNNHAAINPAWYLARNVFLSNNEKQNSFTFLKDGEATNLFDSLMENKTDTAVCFLKSGKPNIVFILVESLTADVVESLGGEKGNSPNIDKLIKEGFSFTNCYASGFRTDQALTSVFSGFPAQPDNSIIRFDDKIAKLPYIPSLFIAQSYKSSFYYGGDLDFSNMKSYLLHAGFQKTIDENSFSSKEKNSKWGAHDEFVLTKQLQDLNTTKQPFFSTLLTLSLHEPFEIPMANHYEGNTEAIKFKNAAYYTDKCLGNYFTEAKKQPWYENTLFVIVADHGHHHPRERDYYDPDAHRIPLVFLGGALKDEFKNKTNDHITNQNDIAALLLDQFKIDHSKFEFSKNTLNKNESFAYICYDDGFGWVTNSCSIQYATANKNAVVRKGNCEGELFRKKSDDGKAFLQVLYKKFVEL